MFAIACCLVAGLG